MLKSNLATEDGLRKLNALHNKSSRESIDRLPIQANYDSLTSLPSRESFNEQLRRAIEVAHRLKSPLAVIILGLNRFRDINHTLGPQFGDRVLMQVAQRFDHFVPTCAGRARLSGDEFGAIFHGASTENVRQICTQILWALETPFFVNDVAIDVTGSIGIAFYPEQSDDANQLLQKASIALDSAKKFDRGYTIYKPSHDPYRQQNSIYITGFRDALDREELVLNYQPKIDFRTGQPIGVEALVRWNHPRFGLVPPKEFITVAERTGLIHKFSQWVVKTALNQCRRWAHRGIYIPVAVNLSPRNLHDPYLSQYVDRLLKKYKLAPVLLELEITEDVVLTDTENVIQTLNDFNRMGVRVYMDDFGTGFSSLNHLRKLPVTGIKIDRSFVSHMNFDANDGVLVRSIIELGHNLGLQTIAEGVESPEIYDQLCSLACDAGQGNYISLPRSPEDLEPWLRGPRFPETRSDESTVLLTAER